MGIEIRPMSSSDLDFAAHCTLSEGWSSETRETFEGFHEYDPNGCLIAESDGRSIGICVATHYGTVGFIGELIVVEAMRGRGVGRQLLEYSIDYLVSRGTQNIFLDGDIPAIPLYERVGYRTICRSLRFVGKVPGKTYPHVQDMSPADLDTVCGIDFEAFGADRSFFLRRRFDLNSFRSVRGSSVTTMTGLFTCWRAWRSSPGA
jgi:GNAT superfamily N-acetyltransferase